MGIRRGRLLFSVLVVGCSATPAVGQWMATGYLGTNVGGVEKGKGGIGASVGFVPGRLGFELDVERHWHFFKDADIGNTGSQQVADIDTRATSLMASVIVPTGATRGARWGPYGVAGLGVIRASFKHPGPTATVHQDDVAFNAGGGVAYSLSSLVGLRLDLRYFRALADQDKQLPAGQQGDRNGFYRDYGFWRVTVGVTFGFSR
jgi:opacity protein-like surface antigen